ncbi:phosphatidylserine decarboxylase [Embleya sp. NBC_00896]|uniref:phosphatidylserine decarboxylase n=1 Tax=Embleya sp. NBC_00896 TaxID=2975961 RepID=UPI00387041CE|nr:phosphatidylserine decarboxylase [Embleya sp. NBC_00896]
MSDDFPSPASAGSALTQKPRLAKGASPWLVPTALTGALTGLAALRNRRWAFAAVPTLALTGGMLWFFRDPERTIGTEGVIASADGVVQSIDAWPDGRTRIATFMSPLNVHVNRAPLDGVVKSVEHKAGGFVPAFNKESEHNERVVWIFDTAIGDVELIQIAGTVARRIVPYIEPGTEVACGDRIGLIRFGSRVDVYLPPGIEPAVTVGQRTTAGETRLDRD